jgi:hypothetical protein
MYFAMPGQFCAGAIPCRGNSVSGQFRVGAIPCRGNSVGAIPLGQFYWGNSVAGQFCVGQFRAGAIPFGAILWGQFRWGNPVAGQYHGNLQIASIASYKISSATALASVLLPKHVVIQRLVPCLLREEVEEQSQK